MVIRPILLAVACLSLANPGNCLTPEINDIEQVIENVVGTKVYWSRKDPECKSNKEGWVTYGFYDPSRNIIIMCQYNNYMNNSGILETLKHEGWHAVQHMCNNYRAALTDEQIRPHLHSDDKHSLRHGYHPKQHRAEAEARVVEQIPTRNWIKGVREYC